MAKSIEPPLPVFHTFRPSMKSTRQRASDKARGNRSGSTNFAVLTTCDRFIIFQREHRGHAAPPEEAREVNDQDERRQDVAAPGTELTDRALPQSESHVKFQVFLLLTVP